MLFLSNLALLDVSIMMPSSDLFQLIKSLTQTEKRYFKIHASRHVLGKSNNYVRLFNAIEEQDAYDEKKIKNIFKEENFVNHFHLAKRYLHRLIKKSLINYHAESTIDAELKDNLRYLEVLFKKGLYEQCEKIIKESLKKANKYDKTQSALELLAWEMELMSVYSFKEEVSKHSHRIFNESVRLMDIHKNFLEYKEKEIEASNVLNRTGFARTKADIEKYNAILNLPFFKKSPNAKSFRSNYIFYGVNSICNYMCNKYANATLFAVELIEYLEKNRHQLAETPLLFVNALHSQIYYQIHFKNYNKALITIQKLRSINTSSQEINHEIFYTANNLEIQVYLSTGKYDQGILLAEKIQNTFEQPYFSKLNEKNSGVLYGSLAKLYLGVARYDKAGYYLNKIFTELKNIRSDVTCILQLLRLIIHYEMGKKDLIEYSVKSTYRYLYKRNRLYKFENTFLNFIRKEIPKMISRDQEIKAFKKLKKNLVLILKDPYEANILKFFDFIGWLNSKIENRPFLDIIRKS